MTVFQLAGYGNSRLGLLRLCIKIFTQKPFGILEVNIVNKITSRIYFDLLVTDFIAFMADVIWPTKAPRIFLIKILF